MPRFAIIIPNLNGAETLSEAISGALAQDLSDACVVVCDNASNDDSVEKIEAISHTKLVKNLYAQRLGKTENWQRAYRSAPDAEYLVTLHGDDRLAPDALMHLRDAADTRPALIHGHAQGIHFNGTRLKPNTTWGFPFRYQAKRDEFRKLLLLNNMVSIVGATLRRDAFEALGGWPAEYNFMQDVEMWYRLAGMGHVTYVPATLGDYRALKAPRPQHHAVFVCETLAWYQQKLEEIQDITLRTEALRGLQHVLGLFEAQPLDVNSPEWQRFETLRTWAHAQLEGQHFRIKATHHQRLLRLKQALEI